MGGWQLNPTLVTAHLFQKQVSNIKDFSEVLLLPLKIINLGSNNLNVIEWSVASIK